MNMKTGEFIRMAGTTMRTLRCYESKNILHPVRNQENTYRSYDEHDLLALWEAKCLNSLSIPLDEVMFFKEEDEIINRMRQIEQGLSRQIEELERRLQSVAATRHRYEVLASCRDCFVPYTYNSICRLFVNTQEALGHPRFSEMIHGWCNAIPLTKFTMTIGHTAITGDPDHILPVKMGLGIMRSRAGEAGLDTEGPAVVYPRCSGHMCHITVESPLQIRERHLSPLLDFIRKEGREITGDFHLRLSHIVKDGESPCYHFFLHSVTT